MYPTIVTLLAITAMGYLAYRREGASALEGLNDRQGVAGACLLIILLTIAFIIPELRGQTTTWRTDRALSWFCAAGALLVFYATALNEGHDKDMMLVKVTRWIGLGILCVGVIIAAVVSLSLKPS